MEFQLFHTTLSASLLLFIMAGGFLAGFVDSIAGGGGLISLPVLLAAGLPPHLAIGTNKFSATFGAVMSAWQFWRAGKVDMGLLKRILPGTFVGAVLGCLVMLYLPSEMFTNELVAAIKNNKNVEFRNRFRNVDVLMLDDIQFIAGRDSTQEEFFHTFNALHSAGKQIIISSDKPPREIARLEERLRSRFEWGLIADIQKPDFDTRIAILRKKAENEGIEISDEMLELIAGRIESNIRELEGSLTRVNAYAKLNHCEINEEVISHALHDIAVVRDPKRITPELIIDCVADYYSLSADMLRGDSRKKEIALARHVAVYLTREMTGLSLPRIGDAFGRDHSTIINSCDKVTKMLDTSSDMKSSIADLKKIITEK